MSIISKLFTVLASSALVFSGFSGVSAQALTQTKFLMVNAQSGIFIRDKNCNKVKSIGYGSVFSKNTDTTITCKINGINIKFVNAYPTYTAQDYDIANIYIAEKYTTEVIGGYGITTESVSVNSINGLNLRNSNCKRIAILTDKTKLKILNTDSTSDFTPICRTQGKYYLMTSVAYNNRNYQVAAAYLK